MKSKMTKNKFFKLASLLVMLCLVTTCAISTTFAKYTTGDSGADQARVAKWGVRVTMVGDDLFKNEYDTDDTDYAGTISVKSSSDDNVVAPGTSGKTTFSIKGTPEVAVKIVIDFDAISDIVLPKGNKGLTEDYHPIVFTLKQTHDWTGEMATPNTLKTGTLKDIKDFIDNYNLTAEYAPNTKLDSTYELSWKWEYENTGKDEADTLLGDVMAGIETVTDAVTEVKYKIGVTVTQID